MNVSPEEARSALDAIREVEQRARHAIRLAGGGPILMIWGVAWLVGNLGSALLHGSEKGMLWTVVNSLGVISTGFVVARLGRRVRNPVGPRIALLWFFLFLYGFMWIWKASPERASDIGFFASTIAMFGYVVLGLWIDLLFMWIGLGVTALTVVIYLLAPEYFELLMGILGGSALFLSGAYIQKSWR